MGCRGFRLDGADPVARAIQGAPVQLASDDGHGAAESGTHYRACDAEVGRDDGRGDGRKRTGEQLGYRQRRALLYRTLSVIGC
jgi:hypothetical protein